MKRTKSIVLSACCLLAALLSGCPKPQSQSGASGTATQKKLKVLCTTSIIADSVREIAGDDCEVSSLMGAGIDPHLYKAKQSDLTALAQADVVFYNGLHLEAKLADVLEQLEGKKKVAAVAKLIPPPMLLDTPDNPGSYDPHIWFDASLWTMCTSQIVQTLVEADPAHANDYNERVVAYNDELLTLHQELQAQAAQIPEAQRIIVTSHDAFRYLGRAYGFEVHGLQGISTEAEAGAGDVQRLVDFVVSNKVPAIFIESSVPQRSIQAVQEGCQAKGWDVAIGGTLFSDALGDPDTDAGTYTGMLRTNMQTLQHALAPRTAEHKAETAAGAAPGQGT